MDPKLRFYLDRTDNVKLKYNPDHEDPPNLVHIGQRKLFLSELRFLTDYYGMKSRERGPVARKRTPPKEQGAQMIKPTV